MKRLIFILNFIFLFFLAEKHVSAQFDNKFYHPDKEWIEINNLNHSDLFLYADGDTIHSVIIEPEGKTKAVVLYFHGNGGNISKWVNHLRPLVNDGFMVCMMDYRGYGKSTGTPTHLNIASDAQLLLDTLLTMEKIGNQKIIVYGASIGTQVATHITRNNNGKVSALILDGMMTSFTDVALMTSPKEFHEQIKAYVTSPYSAIEDIQHIENVNLLFIHSNEDPIPIGGAQEVYDKAIAPKKFWIYEGGHIEAPLKYPDRLVEYVNDFLDKRQ